MDIEQFDLADRRPPDEDPAGQRRWLWVVAAVGAVLAGFVLLGGDPVAEPVPAPLPSGSASAGPPPGPNQRQYLGVSRICSPVTDGRRTLSVSFEVSNISASEVSVGAVTAVLPQGGLVQRGSVVLGGGCAPDPAPTPTRTRPEVIAAGQARFYTLVLDLPRTCPARYPVLVRIGFRAGGFAETSLSVLYNDLSVPEFSSCGRDAPG